MRGGVSSVRKGKIGYDDNVAPIRLQRERVIDGEGAYMDKASSMERCECDPESFIFGKKEEKRTLSPSKNCDVGIQKFRDLMLSKHKSFKMGRDGKKYISEWRATFKHEHGDMSGASGLTRHVKPPLVK